MSSFLTNSTTSLITENLFHILQTPTPKCVCDPLEQFGRPYQRFIAENFKVCVYTPRDWIGWLCGLTNILVWIVAQSPQVYRIYKNKSPGHLSLRFLLLWTIGNVCNLLAAIFTAQMVLLYSAVYFLLMDIVLLGMCFYYKTIYKWRIERNMERDANGNIIPLNSPLPQHQQPQDIGPHPTDMPPQHITESSPLSPRNEKPSDDSHIDHNDNKNDGNDNNNNNGSNIDGSNVPLSTISIDIVHPTTNDIIENSMIPNRSTIFAIEEEPTTNNKNNDDNNDNNTNGNEHSRPQSRQTNKTTQRISPTTATVTTTGSPPPSLTSPQTVLLLSMTILAINVFQTTSATTTSSSLLSSPLLKYFPTSLPTTLFHILQETIPTIPICDAPTSDSKFVEIFGIICAWISGTMYFVAAIPQMIKVGRTKNVYGISFSFFVLQIIANTLYAFSILIPTTTNFRTLKFWRDSFPFILGSLGSNIFNFVILIQFFMYPSVIPMDEIHINPTTSTTGSIDYPTRLQKQALSVIRSRSMMSNADIERHMSISQLNIMDQRSPISPNDLYGENDLLELEPMSANQHPYNSNRFLEANAANNNDNDDDYSKPTSPVSALA